MRYDNTHVFSSRLARRSSSSCLDAQTARLETAGYRLCSGRHRKCRQSMGSSRSHPGRRIPSPGASSWRSIQATAIPTISLARNAAYGRRKLRFPRGRVERSSGGGLGTPFSRYLLSPRSYELSAQTLGMECAETGSSGPAARPRSHCAVAGSDLAATEKKAAVEKRTILCIDEAAFYLLPSVVRTWSPIGVSPVLNAVCCRDHLSAISAITPEGKLYFHLQEGAFDGMDVVRFVCHLLRHIPGKLLIVWDGASIHKGEAIRRLLATDRADDLWLEAFPAYAPELNPDEGIWNYLKNVELKNLCCSDLKELRQKILQAVKRLRQKTHIIKACFQQAGLKL